MPIMAMKAISKMTGATEEVVDLDISSCVSTNLFSSSFIIDEDVSEKNNKSCKFYVEEGHWQLMIDEEEVLPFFVVK